MVNTKYLLTAATFVWPVRSVYRKVALRERGLIFNDYRCGNVILLILDIQAIVLDVVRNKWSAINVCQLIIIICVSTSRCIYFTNDCAMRPLTFIQAITSWNVPTWVLCVDSITVSDNVNLWTCWGHLNAQWWPSGLRIQHRHAYLLNCNCNHFAEIGK